ncbi:peptide MFS transporter [Shewanella intestini]|uniref:Peptide MFS transporter n=1 Tax=Shewanella intestini TaxID=2017544 RepID=A0ABS5HYQ3_9GAMM|nr:MULTISPECIES: MFS transporter [Shewanella]MBR9726922.1 peptide MFS transporter [Shewanella intestini]MRG34512.1 MFS transporter [Shewanella sp. XMDDZSB0408]
MWNKLNKSMMFIQAMFGLAFYGVMSILTRFFLEDLNYSEADTLMVVGAFSSIGPLFSIAGGFIADKFLGAYRSLTVAQIGFTVGYCFLAFGATTSNVGFSLAAIAVISYSRGLMSPSYPGLFKRTFNTDAEFENAFSMNYSINNVGAVLGQYLYPLLIIAIGFSGGFLLSGVMAGLAMLSILYYRKEYTEVATEFDRRPVPLKNIIAFISLSVAMIGLVFFMFDNIEAGKNIVYIIAALAILYFISLIFKAKKSEALRMGTVLIMIVLTICFFVYYGQIMTSMNLVALNTMRGDLFGIIPIAPEASMAMNPFWCSIAGPIIAFVFTQLEKRNITLSTSIKVGCAFVFTAISFGLLAFFMKNIGPSVSLTPEVFLLVHFFQAFAEVIVGSFVVAFILSVTPKQIESFSVSLFSVAVAVSGILGAVISTFIALEKDQKLTQTIVQNVYGDFFIMLSELAVVMVVIAFISSFMIRKMLAAADKAEQLES